jgi:hypothetical protein
MTYIQQMASAFRRTSRFDALPCARRTTTSIHHVASALRRKSPFDALPSEWRTTTRITGGRDAVASPGGASAAGNQAFMQAAPLAQPRFGASHPPSVLGTLVIVPEQVQQSVKRQHAQLRLVRVTHSAGLPLSDARGDDDISQHARLAARAGRFNAGFCGEGQNVGGGVLAAILLIERPDVSVADQRDGNVAAHPGWRHSSEPSREAVILDRPAAAVRDGYPRAFATASATLARAPEAQRRHASTVGIHRTIRTP